MGVLAVLLGRLDFHPFAEAPEHPHLKARNTFVAVDGVVQPAPAPRFSRSVPDTPRPPAGTADADIAAVAAAWRIEREKARPDEYPAFSPPGAS